MEEKELKKSNNLKGWQGVIIGLLIGILLTGFSIGIYDRYILKDSKTAETDKEDKKDKYTQKAESLDVLSDIVQDNLEKYNKAAGHYGGALEEYFKEKRITNRDIDNTLVFATIATSGLMKPENTEEEFEEYVKQYYGDNYEYKHQEMSGKICAGYYYDSNDRKYHEGNHGGCGGAAGPHRFMYNVSQATLIDEELILTIRVLFPGKYEDKNEHGYLNYYSDAKHEKVIKDLDYTLPEGVPYRTQSLFRKGGTYKFVMKKESGDNYSFVSSEPINN